MKATYIFIFLIAFLKSYSQKIFVETSHSKILYCGISNKISVYAEGHKGDMLSVDSNVGELLITDSTEIYLWKICTPYNKKAILKVFAGSKLMDSIIFQIELLPKPTVFVPDNGHRSSAGDIFRKGISASIENFFIRDIPVQVTSFQIGVKYTNSDTFVVHQNEGAKLDKKSKELFEHVRPGSEYFVRQVDLKIGCREDRITLYETFIRKLY